MAQSSDGGAPAIGLLVLRASVGLIFFYHGAKTLGIFDPKTASEGVEAYAKLVAETGLPAPTALAWIFSLANLLGGIALVLGAGVRIVAGVCGATACIYAFYGPNAFAPGSVLEGSVHHAAELAILLAAASLSLVLLGGGATSIDASVARRKAAKG